MTNASFRAGFIAIVGRPNVGKSTLLNHLIGEKISITSRKAQTTQHRITGILNTPDTQFIFVDTPGFQTRYRSLLNQAMNQTVRDALQSVDVIVWVIEAVQFTAEDEKMLTLLPPNRPVILAINKIDHLCDKSALLPFLNTLQSRFAFTAMIPISAERKEQLDHLLGAITPLLPQSPALYDAEQITDRSERFLASELLREKLFRQLGDELPYASTVIIDEFKLDGSMRRIHATIFVENAHQKAIIIGQGGGKLKTLATQARLDMEKLFDGKVFLQVWVKVKSGWGEDARLLKQLGLE